jgi:hypothetical protein
MATVYKNLTSDDVVSTRTLLHEAIPITGTIVSGTYLESGVEKNIKNYAHGRFQSVYDYPVLSSSANHIFDLSIGFSSDSTLVGSPDRSKRVQMYNQMAQILVGHDITGSILKFDADGNFSDTTTDKYKELVFINFSRLLTKDEIKKGSFNIKIGTGASGTPFATTASIADDGAQNDYKVNSPAGEYGILYKNGTTTKAGLIFYQAGIVALRPEHFVFLGDNAYDEFMDDNNINTVCNAVRERWHSCTFNNTTELNSTIYFCRLNHNEFNYSSNPTYLSESQIRVKQTSTDAPISYVTTVGLYSSANELLAVAKLSEPLKKDPTNEMILRVRLDY